VGQSFVRQERQLIHAGVSKSAGYSANVGEQSGEQSTGTGERRPVQVRINKGDGRDCETTMCGRVRSGVSRITKPGVSKLCVLRKG
jgi:hypothetical protein